MKLDRAYVPCELKVAGGGDGRTFEGYGSVFNTIDSYNDTIVKGAFAETVRDWKAKGKLPKMLLQHGGGFFAASADDMVPVGKWDDMREDDYGLFLRGHLFDVDTDRSKATRAALAEGELDGLSIGFRNRTAPKIDKETGIRTLTNIELFEISLVTFPANDPARVTEVRSEELPTEREFERFLRREGGLTEVQAKAVIAKGYRQVRREAMPSDDVNELLDAIRRFQPQM